MKHYYASFVLLLMTDLSFAQIELTSDIGILTDGVEADAIERMDFNNNGQIDPGDEARAVLRYVNHKIFRTYDVNHDGKLTGPEAEKYVSVEVQPGLDTVHEYYARYAYDAADRAFSGGVPRSNPNLVVDTSPLAPRFSKVALSVGYGQKGEVGKDSETIESGFEYKWGSFAIRNTPIVVGFKVSYAKENTFLPTETNKVTRWTAEPLRLTVGADKWKLQPTIALGYGRSTTESIVAGELPTEVKDNEFVWDVGFAVPLLVDWAKLTITQAIRLDNIASGKKSDSIKAGIEFDLQKLLELPK